MQLAGSEVFGDNWCTSSNNIYLVGHVKMMIFPWKIVDLSIDFHRWCSFPLQNRGSFRYPCLMGKSTISMVMFNSYVTNYQRLHRSLEMTRVCLRQPRVQLGRLSNLILREIIADIVRGFRAQKLPSTQPPWNLFSIHHQALALESRPFDTWWWP